MIDIANEHPCRRVDRKILASLLTKTVRAERRKAGTISVILVTDKKISELHSKFLHDSSATDVITFDLSLSEELEGDIVISLDTAARQAKDYGVTLREETGRLAIHGILHLCGYRDRSKQLRAAMHLRENFHLQQAGWLTSKE